MKTEDDEALRVAFARNVAPVAGRDLTVDEVSELYAAMPRGMDPRNTTITRMDYVADHHGVRIDVEFIEQHDGVFKTATVGMYKPKREPVPLAPSLRGLLGLNP